ncbi:MAG: Smr/MutS family protein, partial [Treponema sp.]|nr:Smr/MutS family protein [Treponema sp.]
MRTATTASCEFRMNLPEKTMSIEKDALTDKTLQLLEYAAIMDRVASGSMSEESSAMLRNEKPASDSGAVAEMKEAAAAILSRIDSGDAEPRSSLPSIGFVLPKLAAEGMALEIDELWAIGMFVERGTELCKWIAPPSAPMLPSAPVTQSALAGLLQNLPDCNAVSIEIFRILDREGKLRDLPELRTIKRRIQSLNVDLEAAVARYAATEEHRRMLQSAVPSQRDGRIVLAVKANFRGRIRGIVHEVSSSGQTIFIEPEEVVEKNNDILIEQRNLDAAIQRIMRELTAAIAVHKEALETFHLSLLRIECLRAKARYSRDIKGHFARRSSGDCGSGDCSENNFILRQARHPLLKNAVPIDLEMDGGINTLIITGPNTGGKTVALKTAGLFAMMNQSGLALPAAEGTLLPVFDGVYADIGDEQSIGQSLSTFSAHITNIAGIITHCTERSLILLDELGSGTDPTEGSAIAMAILDHLIEKKSRLIITTHHGVLKNYGYTRQGVENASVEFDSRTLSPTYRIITGIPGESRALDIAGQNGLPLDIVAQARGYLDEERSDVSALIRGLKEKHRELDSAAEESKAGQMRLREDRRQADLKELRLRQKEAELKAGALGKLRLLLDESRKTLENLVREVREGELSRDKTLKVKEFLSELARTVAEEENALDEEERAIGIERQETGTEFAPGVEVFAGKRKQRGTIVRLDKKTPAGNIWIVETGSLKISFPERELIPAAPSQTPLSPLIAADLASSAAACFELNLRGMRLGEAIEALRCQIDAATLSGLKNFSVVHGKGDGILQKGVHDYLKSEPAVADYYFSR